VKKSTSNGEQAQHLVDRAADLARTALAPGPDLGRNVLDRLQPPGAQALGDAEIEGGGIDADEDVRTRRHEARHEGATQAQQARQVRQHLGEPHDRELLGGRPGLAAGSGHLRAGHAKALDLGVQRLERCDQRGSELISRGLPSDDPYAQQRLWGAFSARCCGSRRR
jgi:hypothetical protein